MASEQHISQLSESRFFQRLEQCEKHDGVRALINTVEATWKQADSVTKRVSVDFRDYTLHDMRHLGNVLWLMEQLVPPDFWETPWQPGQPVGPLQCAVSILAVLVHDLGMALPDDKRRQLKSVEDPQQSLSDAGSDQDKDVIAYRRHFMSQEHDVRAIQALERDKPEGYLDRVEHIRQQIRTEYLRQTHADDAIGCEHRIGSWLEHFEKQEKQISFGYAGQPFREKLAQVALSHGLSLAWLEKTFAGNAIETWRTDETIDWLWTGWLLRLGDILDFDASRAPKVLFRQFRPGNDTSIKHWYQHLCIGERVFNSDFSRVEFRASSTGCPNPDILAGVDSYCGWIRDELKGVREQQEERGHSPVTCPLRLPGHGEHDVSHTLQIAGGWNSQPVKFELSQDQVVNILMGEELYGEPSLCLRELIQNALDALHLRWMRTELRRKLEEKHNITPGPGTPEPPELHGLEPVDRVRDKSELQVKVRWGRDTLPDDRWPAEAGRHPREERSFIEIEDNGVGMTFDVVTRYFTQIGCSYYKSPEYSRERALMRDFKLPVSEISQFGIGILSCFMLADLVEVWTVPSRADSDSRQPHHLKVWGPDGLFWHKALPPHDRPCGTSIRMWLRSEIDAVCDPEDLLEELKSYHFGEYIIETYSTSTEGGRTRIDPLRAIWSTVVWPRYPITFLPSAAPESEPIPADVCCLDDTAVLRVLLPLSAEAINSKLQRLCEETDSTPPDVGPLTWRVWDWDDPPTASRVRFAVAVSGREFQRVETARDLFADGEDDFPLTALRRCLAEAILPEGGRTRWIVRGMSIPEEGDLHDFNEFVHGVGACCVVDLSGHAAPGLTGDRTRLKRTQRDDWRPEVRKLLKQWVEYVAVSTDLLSPLRNQQHAIVQYPTHRGSPMQLTDWALMSSQLSLRGNVRVIQQELMFSVGHDRARDPAFARALTLAQYTSFSFDRHAARNLDRDVGHYRNLDRSDSFTRAIDLAYALDLDYALDHDTDADYAAAVECDRVVAHALDFTVDVDFSLSHACRDGMLVAVNYRLILDSHLIGEACYPDLKQSSPVLSLPFVDGTFTDGRLTAPLVTRFEYETRGELTVTRRVGGWDAPDWLNELSYDLVAPFTLHSVGELSQRVPEWGRERHLRAIGMLPFLCEAAIKWAQFPDVLREAGFPAEFVESGSILLLIPGEELLRKPFVEWDRERDNQFVVSALWDVPKNRVLWAEGFHDRKSICRRGTGKSLKKWLKPYRD